MDSTLVAQVTGAAVKLGMKAGEVFVIWFLTKALLSLGWLAFAFFTIGRLTGLLARIGLGQDLLATIDPRATWGDSVRVDPERFKRAHAILLAEFGPKAPPK